MNLEELKAHYDAKEKIKSAYRRTGKNEVLADYYKQLADETGEESYNGNASRISLCARFWCIDFYQKQKVKDVAQISLCHDRFCDNCQNAQAIARERQFEPVLDWFAPRYDIFHVVFTVPNVYPEELEPTLNKMYENIGYMFRLFRGNARIKGYDFSAYKYLGAVRSLEITKGRDGETFHPHFHCLLLLRKGTNFKGKNINSYSFDNADVKRKHRKKTEQAERSFSDFEILLQKIWRLRCEGVRVNKKNILELKEGYSVVINRAKAEDYKEVFKYATKGIFSGKSSRGYNDFVPLALALKSRRITQGYGVFRSIDFEMYTGQENEDETEKLMYENFIRDLKKEEVPVREVEELFGIAREANKGEVVYVTKQKIREIVQGYINDRGK